MIHKFKTSDCPNANDRHPLNGERKWTLSFPLEGGDDYLEVEMGRKGRGALLVMLTKELEDDTKEPPLAVE